jgi:hypothetical protein
MNINTHNYQAYEAVKAYRDGPSIRKARNKSSPQPAASNAAKVDFSKDAETIQKVKNKIQSLPDERWSIAKRIKKRIEHNDYPIENRLHSALDNMLKDNVLNPFLHSHN